VSRPGVRVVYRGGPADGATETFVPALGEAVDVRCVPVVPRLDVSLTPGTVADYRPSPVAEYRLVWAEWLTLDEGEAAMRGYRPGSHLVAGVYEFHRLT
jgi:hypothetical protein